MIRITISFQVDTIDKLDQIWERIKKFPNIVYINVEGDLTR